MTDLLSLKKELQHLKEEVLSVEGRKAQLMERLKEEFDCDTIEEADKVLKEMEEKKEELANKLEKRLQSFRKKYEGLLQA